MIPVTTASRQLSDTLRVDQATLAFVLLGLFGAHAEDAARLERPEARTRQVVAAPAEADPRVCEDDAEPQVVRLGFASRD